MWQMTAWFGYFLESILSAIAVVALVRLAWPVVTGWLSITGHMVFAAAGMATVRVLMSDNVPAFFLPDQRVGRESLWWTFIGLAFVLVSFAAAAIAARRWKDQPTRQVKRGLAVAGLIVSAAGLVLAVTTLHAPASKQWGVNDTVVACSEKVLLKDWIDLKATAINGNGTSVLHVFLKPESVLNDGWRRVWVRLDPGFCVAGTTVFLYDIECGGGASSPQYRLVRETLWAGSMNSRPYRDQEHYEMPKTAVPDSLEEVYVRAACQPNWQR